jgi:hypothetical protein
MKYFISILLVLSFLTQNISKLVIVINFRINQEYIAKNLCEKKDEPESCCHGKCELKKQLAEEDKKENLPATTFKDKFEKQNYYSPALNVFAAGQFLSKPNFNYISSAGSSELNEIFHPPPFTA